MHVSWVLSLTPQDPSTARNDSTLQTKSSKLCMAAFDLILLHAPPQKTFMSLSSNLLFLPLHIIFHPFANNHSRSHCRLQNLDKVLGSQILETRRGNGFHGISEPRREHGYPQRESTEPKPNLRRSKDNILSYGYNHFSLPCCFPIYKEEINICLLCCQKKISF